MKTLLPLEDDGLFTPEVGEWAEEKYQLVQCYAQVFATAMKGWECRVYIDLFAGAGRARLRDSKKIVSASPILTLGISNPFDRYIFCELDKTSLDALHERVRRDHANLDVEFVTGDSNSHVNDILKLIPRHSRNYRVLTFCFVDPFRIENLKFATLEHLAAKDRRIDFLVLIPSGMDAQRNWQQENALYSEFLGDTTWRDKWQQQGSQQRFATFFVSGFAGSMQRIGFRWNGLHTTQVVKNEKNSPMYHLAFFSRADIAGRFWDDCKKYAAVQPKLPFM